MKKIFLLLMLIPCLSFGQGYYNTLTITEADSSSLEALYIASTNIDTTDYFMMWPSMAFNFLVADTSTGGDSSSVEFFVDACTDPVNLLDWVREDSLTISSDSVWTSWNYTDEPRRPFPYRRIRAVGQAGNKKLSPSKSIIRKGSWHSTRRY